MNFYLSLFHPSCFYGHSCAGLSKEEIANRISDDGLPKDIYATEEGQLAILTLLQLGMAERTLTRKVGHNVFDNLVEQGLIEKREKKICLTMAGVKKLLEKGVTTNGVSELS